MDILMNAANASNVEKTYLSMLELDWEGDDRGLRLKHQDDEVMCYWLKLTIEEVDRLSRTMLDCLMNHDDANIKCGNYSITMDVERSKEGSLKMYVGILRDKPGSPKTWTHRSFNSYIGGISLLEGICEFRRLNNLDCPNDEVLKQQEDTITDNLDHSNDEILKQQEDSVTDNLTSTANTSAAKKQMRIEWNKRENMLLFYCIENGVKSEEYIELEADRDLIVDILYILYNKLTEESEVYLGYEIRDKNESILHTIYGEGTSAEPHKLQLIFEWDYLMRCTKDNPDSFSYMMHPESFWEKVSWEEIGLWFDEYEGGKELHEGIMDFIKENDLVSESWEKN